MMAAGPAAAPPGSQNVRTIRALHRCLAACLLLSLAACGGGGGSPGTRGGSGTTPGGGGNGGGGATPVVDKYVGTWVRCVSNGAGTSMRETLALDRTTDTTMTFSDTQVGFNNTSCTGTGNGQVTTTGTVLFNGKTKTIGSDTVDEVQIQQTNSGALQNQVMVVHPTSNGGTNLSLGLVSQGATFDTSGFPNALDPNAFTLQ
jgi:hypothetical protein